MIDSKKSLVSLVIPAFKQEKTIKKDLLRISHVMDQIRYEYEMIVVVDGVTDDTYKNAKKLESEKIKVLSYEKNLGKGYALRYGISHTKGDIIGFIDSGMDLNPNGLSMLLEHFEWYNADIIIGSKRHPVSKVDYPVSRKIVSFLSQIWIKLLFGLNVRDTQVGMKFFRKKVIEDVLPRLLVKQFAFDIEILVVAHHLGYKRIFEAPVEISMNFKNSTINTRFFQVLLSTLIDTVAIFYRLRILRYYSNARSSMKGA